jgi:hypothetical protein
MTPLALRSVLIPAARKGPVVHGWQHLVVSTEEVERHLAAGGNVGAIMGSLSGDLVDTDLDCQGCNDRPPRGGPLGMLV